MSRILTLLMAVMVSITASAENGQKLHDAACLNCHASLTGGHPTALYLRADRKVTSLDTLKKRVDYCVIAADVDWSPAQKSAVVDYLKKRFYKF